MQPHASPTAADTLGEIASLIGVVAFYGPPGVFIVAPWLVLGLILIGPFALVLTVVVALLVAAALVAGIAAIVATPFLMIRSRRSARASIVRPAASVQVEPRHVIA
jgi:hypothetical protein